MNRAFWEQTDDPSETEWYSGPPRLRPDHPRLKIFLKNIARKKMITPYLISAEFSGVREVFDPWITLLIDEGNVMRFYGIYITSLAIDEPLIRPSVCLRRGVWNGSEDFEKFYQAQDKALYIAQEQPVRLIIKYFFPHAISLLLSLSEHGVNIFRQGIKLKQLERANNTNQNILINLWDGSVNYTLSYSPLSHVNDDIEKWVEEWTTAFNDLNISSVQKPDGASRVSYQESLTDWIKYFSSL